MLKKLIAGLERPDVVLIKDCLDQSGYNTLKAFIVGLADRVSTIELYLYEFTSERFTSDLPPFVLRKLSIHDMTGDPFGWVSGCASIDMLPRQPEIAPGQTAALVFDSLSNLLQGNSVTSVCRMIHQLAGRTNSVIGVEQIVAVIHKDVHDILTLHALEHTASCVLNLSLSSVPDHASKCCTVIKHSVGKLSTFEEHFVVTNSFSLNTIEVLKPSKVDTSKPSPDPTASLTFSLNLKKDEEEARRQLVLPYLVARDTVNSNSKERPGSGHVTYTLEEADIDEEDPDDDLDI